MTSQQSGSMNISLSLCLCLSLPLSQRASSFFFQPNNHHHLSQQVRVPTTTDHQLLLLPQSPICRRNSSCTRRSIPFLHRASFSPHPQPPAGPHRTVLLLLLRSKAVPPPVVCFLPGVPPRLRGGKDLLRARKEVPGSLVPTHTQKPQSLTAGQFPPSRGSAAAGRCQESV